MANQAYFSNNFYQCAVATAAGESPDTTPASWRRIRIPTKFRFALAKLTEANLLEADGQLDKAEHVRADALNRERIGLDDLIRYEQNREPDQRPNVRVAC